MSLVVDGAPAEECPVCEDVWGIKYDADDAEVWRFEAHQRRHFPKKGTPFNLSCDGGGLTFDEAWSKKRELDAQ